MIEVTVRNNNVILGLKYLRRLSQREMISKRVKEKRYHKKKSIKLAEKREENRRRKRKINRKSDFKPYNS